MHFIELEQMLRHDASLRMCAGLAAFVSMQTCLETTPRRQGCPSTVEAIEWSMGLIAWLDK